VQVGNLLQRARLLKKVRRAGTISRLTSVFISFIAVCSAYHHVVRPRRSAASARRTWAIRRRPRSGRRRAINRTYTVGSARPPQPVPPTACPRANNPPAAHGCRPGCRPLHSADHRSASRPMSNRGGCVLVHRSSAGVSNRGQSREISPPQLFSDVTVPRGVAAAPAAMGKHHEARAAGGIHQSPSRATPPASMMTARSVRSAAWSRESCRQLCELHSVQPQMEAFSQSNPCIVLNAGAFSLQRRAVVARL